MKHELWYSVVVRDRHGKVVSRERRRSKSFLKQWNQLVYVQMATASLDGVVDTGGVGRSVTYHTNNFAMAAAAGLTTYGIRVGTGNTAVDISDHALETPIEEGGGVEHLACTVADYVVAAPSCSFLVSRTITNNSGAEITVREAGIYVKMMYGSTPYYACVTRDVLITPQVVPNGGSILIEWTIGVTV